MDSVELRSLTRKQLVALAMKAGIPRRSRLAKNQLIAALAARAEPQELTDLPMSYGRTRLTLMEIEPYWIYAYWEVTSQDSRAVSDRMGKVDPGTEWVLRFYDITGGSRPAGAAPHVFFDVSVDLRVGNWYINLWSGDKSYFAEAGLRSAAGRFVPVCRSNVVCVPRAGPPPDGADESQEGKDALPEDMADPRPEPLAVLEPSRDAEPDASPHAAILKPSRSGAEDSPPVPQTRAPHYPPPGPDFLLHDGLFVEGTGSFVLGIARGAAHSAEAPESGSPRRPRRLNPKKP